MRPTTLVPPSALPLLLALSLLAGWSAPALAQRTSRHGGIEIGAKGVKATVLLVRVDKQGHPEEVTEPSFKKTANTSLAVVTKDPRSKKVKFKETAIKDTAEEVGKFFKLMQDKFRVPPEKIYVIGSSGLPDATNKDELVKAVQEATRDGTGRGKKLIFINQKEEVHLSILGALPAEELGNSIFVDVGSGSTKCGYIEQKTSTSVQRVLIVSANLQGTSTYTRRVAESMTKEGKDFAGQADALREACFTEPLREELERFPGLVNRKRVFLSGGIVWAIVTILKPESVNEPLVPITSNDIEKFYQRLKQNPNVFPEPNLAAIADAELREAAAKELQQLSGTFTTENLLAGTEILRGVGRAFRLEQQQKTIYFARNGYIAWIYAFVKEKTPQPSR